ncbi:hypothetical protein OPT61_g9304 [Boeremia exigua]|uniref:Uncharacterized protein n=1 Tax=Boeremia exigua TaxID=749465 RepID=A0ACC2HV04_9PLEO|nr:hypothetical protein OPT61_g9304 [Boeremia exigua]
MIIFKDILTDDEIISDSYDLKEVDGVVYEADCKKINVGGETFDTGANASAEEAEEGADDSVETKIDVVHSFRLNETNFDKKGYLTYLKGYMKAVKAKLQEKGASAEEVTAFEKGAAGYAKKIVANFKDYEFLIGESMDPDGMIVLLNYREDGVTPYVTVWKHGLSEMKRVRTWPLRHQEQQQPQASCLRLQIAPRLSLNPHSFWFILRFVLHFGCCEAACGFVVMQQPPRLALPGNGSAGPRSRAAPASVPPLTPRKKGEGLDNLLRSLDEKYQLGLNIRTVWTSPARRKTAADGVLKTIRFLYYRQEAALNDALVTFETTAEFIAKDQRLDVLANILRNKHQSGSPITRSGTPTSATNAPPTNSKTPHPYFTAVEDTPRTRGLFNNHSHDVGASLRAGVSDPGSPTDEDEDDFVTPPSLRQSTRSPSPSVTSKSAMRRVEASAHLSLQGTSRKRPSDGSLQNGKAKKLTKTSEGEQPIYTLQAPVDTKPSPSLFKKPALNQARSFNVLPASQSTVNTSFNTMSSSQQTQPDTANTSFMSDANPPETSHALMTRGISTTFGTLNDQGLGSSIPEEDLLSASAQVESLHAVPSISPRRLSLSRAASCLEGSKPAMSPSKNEIVANSRDTTVFLNQSFPPPGKSVSLFSNQSALQPRSLSAATPTRPQQRSPREQTPLESPSKIAHHIRDIPKQGLFVSEPPYSLRAMPYSALFICQRISLECSTPVEELVSGMDIAQACADPWIFWESLLQHPKITQIKFKDPDRLWSSAKRGSESFTFKGQINLRRKRSGPIFHLDLHPILPDRSCRFQRKFGSDRFLYLNVPDLHTKSWSGGSKADLELVRQRWDEWISSEHSFLFRKWRVFHIEPLKKAKTKGRNAEATHSFRVVLFATEGCGITHKYSLGELTNWFFPFNENLEQGFCKAFARLDLGLSRTTPALIFKPSQVIYVDDILANGDPEATEFDDPRFKWKLVSSSEVMNDGCSIVSVGAALEIWRLYKKFWGVTGPLPSGFQGRIGGAKGLWMVSAESYTKDPEHLEIWIKISKSQLKFCPHPDDLSDATFDRLRLTFEVSNYSTAPRPAELHISFIPIMTDRGVPRDVIAEYIRERLDADRSELLDTLTDPVKLYEYVHKNSSKSKEGADMPWQASLPSNLDDKLKLFLESGASPVQLQILAKYLLRFIKKQHLLQESKLRTPLGKGTYLYGVADPLGVLEPGEVHVQFSSSFVDELTNEKYLNLKGHNLLVARQPAVRNSDMQKVRAVLHPELSHLVDVVVFPSKGQFPLAGKLQGGDYDGDIFWLCWEDRLVAPFRNAPAPVRSPDPEQYGIRVNRETLRDLQLNIKDESSFDNFLRKAITFRSTSSLLGIVTTFLEKQSYLENRMSSSKLDPLADIHDLLVDAAKQGYTFTLANWFSYLRGTLKCNVKLRQPIYKDAMDACAAVKDSGADVDKTREKKYKYKVAHIIDYLYFEVVRDHNVATMKQLQVRLSSATQPDADLLYPYQQLIGLNDPVIKEELRRVREEFERLYNIWNTHTHKDDKDKGDFPRVVEHLHVLYKDIMPVNENHPTIKFWLHPWLRPDFCLWDRLKASMLYNKLQQPGAQTFVFQMAGDELLKIKAETFPRTRYIVASIRANMKPKPIKALVDDDSDEEDDDASVLE